MGSLDIEQRIKGGRRAIALARERGLDASSWEEELARLEEELRRAQEVAAQTRELLETRGWCLWQCRALDNEVIVVAKDEFISGFPDDYPVYTEQELASVTEFDSHMLKLVHEAKKLAGARIVR